MPTLSLFVSHSHQDNSWCRDFVAGLHSAGWDIWYDEKGLSGGAAWVATIQHEIETRDAFMLILTPDAWASRWVHEELDLALATNRRVLPVLHKPTQVEGFIRTRQWIHVVGLPGHAAATKVSVALGGLSLPLTSSSDVSSLPAYPPSTASPSIPPDRFPPELARLGYQQRVLDGIEVILPPLCAVPGGEFLMGSDHTKDPRRLEDEEPQHWVKVPSFSIARFPVTVAEYACFVRDGGPEPRSERNNPTWQEQYRNMLHPVVNVSWSNAAAYVAWLRTQTGQSWRLPSEAEWEKAARWNSSTRTSSIFPWGDRFEQSRCNTFSGGDKTTTSVGSYPTGASPCGAEDMAGNVWEWTRSLLRPYPYNKDDGRETSNSSEERVLRGACWGSTPENTRLAFRRGAQMTNSSGGIRGFRIMLASERS